MLKSEFLRHGSIVFASTMLVNVLNFVFHFVLSRKLGIEGYGALSSLLAAIMIFSVPSVVLNSILVKYASEFHVLGDMSKLSALSRRLFMGSTFVGVVIVAVSFVLREPIARYLRIDSMPAIVGTGAVLAVSLVLPCVRGVFQGVQDFRTLGVTFIIEAIGKLFFGILFVWVGFGVVGAIVGILTGSVVSLVFSWIVAQRRLGKPAEMLNLNVLRLMQSTLGIGLSTVAMTVMGFSDLVLVKHFSSLRDAGIYGAVTLTGKLLLFLVGFVPTIVLPKASRLAAQGANPMRILIQAALLTATVSGLGLLVFHQWPLRIVTMMAGAAYAVGGEYIFAYGVVMVFLAGITVASSYQIGLHRFGFIWPLLTIMVAEIIGMSLFHTTLWSIIKVLLIGHALGLIVVVYRISAPSHPVADCDRLLEVDDRDRPQATGWRMEAFSSVGYCRFAAKE
ncbi:MAG TPA: oligosaccharide flippase family protein [Candidatus Baltobacteraceae bacterium]|nr:oligosaccharide flippase family protein [Candidatus Baltobacteraceae bacterium]